MRTPERHGSGRFHSEDGMVIMEKKARYEPPLLVDMRGDDLCGQFAKCQSGDNIPVSLDSCMENVNCHQGLAAEQCMVGSNACGCDGCCSTGFAAKTSGSTNWSKYSNGCQCKNGGVAFLQCTVGYDTGRYCALGQNTDMENQC